MRVDQLRSRVNDAITKSTNRFELWDNILNLQNLKTVCEIGVWKGDFAKYLLDHHKYINKYIFIDPWRNLSNWNKPANVSNEEFEQIRHEAFSKNNAHYHLI